MISILSRDEAHDEAADCEEYRHSREVGVPISRQAEISVVKNNP